MNYKYYLVRTDNMDVKLMGLSSEEWLMREFPQAERVSLSEVGKLLASSGNVIIYDDTPLLRRKDVERIVEEAEIRGLDAVELKRMSITGSGKPVRLDMADEALTRLTPLTLPGIVNSLKEEILLGHMQNGVIIYDKATTFIDAETVIGSGTVIKPFNVLEGKCVIGKNVVLSPRNTLTDTIVKDGSSLIGMVATEAVIGENCKLGPYSYLRPGTVVADGCKVGDFVEIKNSNIGPGTKVPHLSYVGDADVGGGVNIGCGVIVANYDGKKKHRTTIKDKSFIGSNTTLIAPVTVGETSFIAAGSTVAHGVPDGSFVIARSMEVVKPEKGRKYLEK